MHMTRPLRLHRVLAASLTRPLALRGALTRVWRTLFGLMHGDVLTHEARDDNLVEISEYQ